MVEVVTKELESKADNLIQLCNQLKNENLALLQKQDELIAEKTRLAESNQFVQQKLEVLLGKLKLMVSKP